MLKRTFFGECWRGQQKVQIILQPPDEKEPAVKTITLLTAFVALFAFALPALAADAPITDLSGPDAVESHPLPSARISPEGDKHISAVQAIDFLAMTTSLGMEEMGDVSLETMVCTPHALPRKLFFQALCPCATDPDTKVSDLEVLALAEEMDRSGESGSETALTLKDVEQDATSAGFIFQTPVAEVNACSFPTVSSDNLASGSLPDDWATMLMRSQTASF